MALASRSLPDFKKPPVVEVAISAFFAPLTGLRTVHFGEFWIANRKQYPKHEDYPPLNESIVELLALPLLPLRRTFMITSDDRYIMQLQQDAFIHNWRKIKDEDEYPHFEAARALFRENFEQFRAFVKNNDLGQMTATRYEVTYVNHLHEADKKYLELLTKDIGLVRLQPATERNLLTAPRSMNADVWFDMPDDQGTLRVSIKQGTRASDNKEVLQVELTSRGKAKSDFSDLDTWLDLAHEWIVRGFAEITTAEAHNKWGRTL